MIGGVNFEPHCPPLPHHEVCCLDSPTPKQAGQDHEDLAGHFYFDDARPWWPGLFNPAQKIGIVQNTRAKSRSGTRTMRVLPTECSGHPTRPTVYPPSGNTDPIPSRGGRRQQVSESTPNLLDSSESSMLVLFAEGTGPMTEVLAGQGPGAKVLRSQGRGSSRAI